MTITFNELDAVITEAEPFLRGRVLAGFRDAGLDSFTMVFEKDEDSLPWILRLHVSVRRGLARAHLTPRPTPRKKDVPATSFAKRLDAELKGMTLEEAGLLGHDRVLRLNFHDPGSRKKLSLVAELIGRHANLLLLDREGTILELYRVFEGKNRCVRMGISYQPLPVLEPAAKKRGSPEPAELRFKTGSNNEWAQAPLNGAADSFFLALDVESRRARLEKRINKHIARRLKKVASKKNDLQMKLEESGKAERLKKLGDLLQANFHRIERGISAIEVKDLFSPEQNVLAVPLDPAKDASSNIAEYYHRYKKLKSGAVHLLRMIEENERTGNKLKELQARLSRPLSMEEIEEIESELGIGPVHKPDGTHTEKKDGKRKQLFDGRKYLSSDGFVILVGRDGSSNDRLTFRTARGNDMWLHCAGQAGSHVIIRSKRDKSIPLTSLIEAALVAMHFSKARGSGKAEVLYTQRKNISRAKGGPPGKVRVQRHKTLNIDYDPAKILRILDTAGGNAAT